MCFSVADRINKEMKKFIWFLALLAFAGLSSFTSALSFPGWYNASGSFREVYNITSKSSLNTSYQVLHFVFANQTGTAFPVMDFNRANNFSNISLYLRYVNQSEEPLFAQFGKPSTALSYWESEYSIGNVKYRSLWVRVPSLSTTGSQLVVYEGTNGGLIQYNETGVFQDFTVAYLFEKNAGSATEGFNSNWNNANASDTAVASFNTTFGGQSFSSGVGGTGFLNTSLTANSTGDLFLLSLTKTATWSTGQAINDVGGGFVQLGFNGANYGCLVNDGSARTAVTTESNFANGSTYSIGCLLNTSKGGAGTQNLTMLVNGAFNASSIAGTLGGVAQNIRVGSSVGNTNPAFFNSFLWVKGGSSLTLNESFAVNIQDSTLTYDSNSSGSDPLIQIYSPANTTVYNGTGSSTSLVFSVNSSINSTNLNSWSLMNNLLSNIGYISNGTTNTTSLNGLRNGINNLVVFAWNAYGANTQFVLPFDEGSGSNAQDVSNNQNFTLAPTVSYSTYCPRGGCVNFTGSGGGVTSSGTYGGYSSYSACTWIYVNGNAATGSSTNQTNQRIMDNSVMNINLINVTMAIQSNIVTSNGAGTVTSGTIPYGTWTFICQVYSGASIINYINAVQTGSSAITGTINASTTPMVIGNNASLNRPFNGSVDEFYLYGNRALSTTEQRALMNLNTNRFGNASISFTLFNGLNLTVYNASQATSTYLSGWSVNISNTTNSSLNPAQTSPALIDTRNIPNGGGVTNLTVNGTFSKLGYVDVTYSLSSDNNSLFSYNIPLWRSQQFSATSSNGSAISAFSLQICGGTNCSTYTTTNGSVNVSLGSIPFGNFIATYSAAGSNTTNFTINANASSEINVNEVLVLSGLLIYAFDEASCAATCQRIYFSFSDTNGTSSASDYNSNYFWNGTYLNSSLVQGVVTFTFNNSVNGTYQSRNYILTISSSLAQTLNVYLLNASITTQNYAYCVQTFSGNPISGATITIQRSIAGSYVTVAQGTAGSSGCYTFYLDGSISYQVIASATGYTTGTFTSQPFNPTIIRLASGSLVSGFQTAYADTLDIVETIMQPSSNSLSGDWVLVNFTVYSHNATLTNWGMNCNYNGTTIYNNNLTTSPSGGSTTSNITLTNKTGSFYCFGLFDRTGYNTTYINQTFYVNFFNASYINVSLYQIFNTTASQSWSPQIKAAAAFLTTFGVLIGTSALVGGASAWLITIFVLAMFSFINFIPILWFIFIVLVGSAWAWFISRMY